MKNGYTFNDFSPNVNSKKKNYNETYLTILSSHMSNNMLILLL